MSYCTSISPERFIEEYDAILCFNISTNEGVAQNIGILIYDFISIIQFSCNINISFRSLACVHLVIFR